MKINATRMLDDEVYIVMEDVPTKQFDFVVKEAGVNVDAPWHRIVNAFDILRSGASRVHVMLPPPRATADNTANDKRFNDIRVWLEENGVGWPRNEVGIQGRRFMNRITTALFPLTIKMFTQMSDKHNEGTRYSLCLLFALLLFKKSYTNFVGLPFPSPQNVFAPKPFSNTILCQFTDRPKDAGLQGETSTSTLGG